MEKKDGQISVTGFIGKDHKYKELEDKKTVISFTIKPLGKDGSGQEKDWVRVKAWNDKADVIKNAIENDDIKKFQLVGQMKPGKPYEKDGKKVEYQELVVDSVTRYKTMEINGVIAKVDEKKTANDKPYTHVFIKNNVGDKVEQFNVSIFPENKKAIPADAKLEVGQPIAIKGEAQISRYTAQDKTIKESINITAWNVDRTPTKLKEQIETLKKNAEEKTASKEPKSQSKSESKEESKAPKKAAASKTKKSKDAGVSM